MYVKVNFHLTMINCHARQCHWFQGATDMKERASLTNYLCAIRNASDLGNAESGVNIFKLIKLMTVLSTEALNPKRKGCWGRGAGHFLVPQHQIV